MLNVLFIIHCFLISKHTLYMILYNINNIFFLSVFGLCVKFLIYRQKPTLSFVHCVCFSQAFHREQSGSDVVFCEVHLLRTVGLSDPLWLSHPCSGELPHQELQLCQPLPVPGVSYAGKASSVPDEKTGPRFRSRQFSSGCGQKVEPEETEIHIYNTQCA